MLSEPVKLKTKDDATAVLIVGEFSVEAITPALQTLIDNGSVVVVTDEPVTPPPTKKKPKEEKK